MEKSTFKKIGGFDHIPYKIEEKSEEQTLELSESFRKKMDKRRSVRDFSDKPVSKHVIEKLIVTASSAPSGAHKQPWTFCAISNFDLKKQIRSAAEKEEYESYHGRMSDEWLEDLKAIGTDWHKPFLENAPWLVVVFKKIYNYNEHGGKANNYYVNESVGLACGFLITAIHEAGLVTLTHTPSPMNFLTEILKRPENERPFLLLPIGYPAENVYVPNLKRKRLEQVSDFYE